MDEFTTLEEQATAMEDAKLKKREAAKRHQEKVKADAQDRTEAAKALIAHLKDDMGIWDKLSEEMCAFLEKLAYPKPANSTSAVFVKLFGDKAKVGDSITLADAFAKTLKGKPALDTLVKKWADKGTIIVFTENKEDMLKSTYTIEAL